MNRLLHPTLILALLLTAACGRPELPPVLELTGSTMGTGFVIKLVAPPEQLSKNQLKKAVRQRLEQIEDLASTYRPQSELSRFNASNTTDWIEASPELCRLIERALEISALTEGAFDITVGPLVNLWGFGPGGAITEPPARVAVETALERVGYRQLDTRCSTPALRKLHPAMYVDLSAWAKGYAVDALADLLDEKGLSRYLVEIGGEMRVRGHNANGQPWRLAVERPATGSRRQVETVFHLTDTGIATSGDYRNFFEFSRARYSHTIDPRNGWPVAHDTASVTVLDPSAAVADAMATALLVLGAEAGTELADRLGTAAYFQERDGPHLVSTRTRALEILDPS